jgi:acetoin utilization deacetylase AcuC-like enzyme
MTLLCYDSVFLEHDTGSHPESFERLQAVWKHLTAEGLDKKCGTSAWKPATLEQLSRIHDPSYIDVIRKSAELGGGQIEPDTMVSPLSYHVAEQASGAVCHCVEEVIVGNHTNALCLVRPPGHHARPRNAMGFCLFNHIAVGARHATDGMGLDRVLVVDWDVHHGNGTQESFYEEENLGYFSIHRSPFYPGTGKTSETGRGAGLGTTLNVALEFGVEREVYLESFERALEDIAKRLQPELIMISAGFDAHRSDPIGSLGLEVEDFGELTRVVRGVANEYCEGKIVSSLEGGYNPHVLAQCVESHLVGLLEDD